MLFNTLHEWGMLAAGHRYSTYYINCSSLIEQLILIPDKKRYTLRSFIAILRQHLLTHRWCASSALPFQRAQRVHEKERIDY